MLPLGTCCHRSGKGVTWSLQTGDICQVGPRQLWPFWPLPPHGARWAERGSKK